MSVAGIGVTPGANLPSSEFGLAMGFIVGRHLLGMQDLHYGYWPADLPVTPQNLPRAQANYTELLISHIPSTVRSILDVGCGVGTTARKLLERGFQVDGVSPNGVLTDIAKRQVGDRAQIFETQFQNLATDRRYDLILFSESLLFIPLDAAFTQAVKLLRPGGYVLITDIFRMPVEGESPIGGGHNLQTFRDAVARFPFQQVEDFDMTDGIAKTFDLLDETYRELIEPAYRMLLARITASHPWIMKVVRWKMRKKMTYYEEHHFSGKRNGASFKKWKSYRLLLFRKV